MRLDFANPAQKTPTSYSTSDLKPPLFAECRKFTSSRQDPVVSAARQPLVKLGDIVVLEVIG
jgi:hypothetical protein